MNGKRSDPPRVAIWLLQHCYSGDSKDALTGDLIERFREGQTGDWLLRQVLVAIGVSVKGALAMQLSTNALKIVGAMAAAGVLLALPVTHFMPERYVSMGAMTAISTSPEPLTPRQLQERIGRMRTDLLSRTTLSEIIREPSLDLYKPQRQRTPMEEVTEQMRENIDVWGVFYPDHKRMALWVKFAYRDRHKAQGVVNALLARIDDPGGRREKLEVMHPANLPDSPLPNSAGRFY